MQNRHRLQYISSQPYLPYFMHSHKTFDPGTGEDFTHQTKRIINRDGSFNVIRTHVRFSPTDLYQHLVDMSWRRFLLLLGLFYLLVNLFFGTCYYLIGIEYLVGAHAGDSLLGFLDAFFFSVQTFTTVGYGTISPDGTLTNALASVEAIFGWVIFALSTGLLYGRFSRPTTRLYFSHNALISPTNGVQALQVRVANARSNTMIETEARLMLVVSDEKLHFRRLYYDLKLERNSIFFFALNWTLVHYITEESPLYGRTPEDLERLHAELLVLVKGYDDTFNQTVHARYSYRFNEFKWNVRFKRAYYPDQHGNVILDLDLINETEPLEEVAEKK